MDRLHESDLNRRGLPCRSRLVDHSGKRPTRMSERSPTGASPYRRPAWETDGHPPHTPLNTSFGAADFQTPVQERRSGPTSVGSSVKRERGPPSDSSPMRPAARARRRPSPVLDGGQPAETPREYEACVVCRSREDELHPCNRCGQLYHEQCAEAPIAAITNRMRDWHCPECELADPVARCPACGSYEHLVSTEEGCTRHPGYTPPHGMTARDVEHNRATRVRVLDIPTDEHRRVAQVVLHRERQGDPHLHAELDTIVNRRTASAVDNPCPPVEPVDGQGFSSDADSEDVMGPICEGISRRNGQRQRLRFVGEPLSAREEAHLAALAGNQALSAASLTSHLPTSRASATSRVEPTRVPPFYQVGEAPPQARHFPTVPPGSSCRAFANGIKPCREARGDCAHAHGFEQQCEDCPCACGQGDHASHSSSGRGSQDPGPDDRDEYSRFWPDASDGYSSAGSVRTDPRIAQGRRTPDGRGHNTMSGRTPTRRAPTRARQHTPENKGGDGKHLNSAFQIEHDDRIHTLWCLPSLRRDMFPGVTPKTFANLIHILSSGGTRAVTGAIASLDAEQQRYFQGLTGKEHYSEKKDARTIDTVAASIISNRKRQREKSTAAVQDRAPSLPLSLTATKRPEHVSDLIALVRNRFQINFHQIDLLFELIGMDVKQAVIEWGAAQGPGTECLDTSLKKKPLFEHWVHALLLLHDTVEVEQARVDEVMNKLERLLRPHKAHEFSDVEKYLDVTLAAYTLAITEPALTARMKEGSWTRTRLFVEQAMLPKQPATTLWHAHVYHALKLAYTKLLNEDARRRGAACDDAAAFAQPACVKPPEGFPRLDQIVSFCKSKLTTVAKDTHRTQLAAMGIDAQTDSDTKTAGRQDTRGRTRSPDARSDTRQRSRSRERRQAFQRTVAAAAIRCDLSEDRAAACFRDVRLAGSLVETSTGPSCYACGSSDHLIRDCPQKVDGVRVGRVVKCFHCQHPQWKIPAMDQEHPFHKCPQRPPTKTKEDARKVWCFQCKGDHTLRQCPKLSPAQLEAWLQIMRPKRDGQEGRAGWKSVAAFQIKLGTLAAACISGKKPRVPSKKTASSMVKRFDAGAPSEPGFDATITAAIGTDQGLDRIEELSSSNETASDPGG